MDLYDSDLLKDSLELIGEIGAESYSLSSQYFSLHEFTYLTGVEEERVADDLSTSKRAVGGRVSAQMRFDAVEAHERSTLEGKLKYGDNLQLYIQASFVDSTTSLRRRRLSYSGDRAQILLGNYTLPPSPLIYGRFPPSAQSLTGGDNLLYSSMRTFNGFSLQHGLHRGLSYHNLPEQEIRRYQMGHSWGELSGNLQWLFYTEGDSTFSVTQFTATRESNGDLKGELVISESGFSAGRVEFVNRGVWGRYFAEAVWVSSDYKNSFSQIANSDILSSRLLTSAGIERRSDRWSLTLSTQAELSDHSGKTRLLILPRYRGDLYSVNGRFRYDLQFIDGTEREEHFSSINHRLRLGSHNIFLNKALLIRDEEWQRLHISTGSEVRLLRGERLRWEYSKTMRPDRDSVDRLILSLYSKRYRSGYYSIVTQSHLQEMGSLSITARSTYLF